MKPRSRDNAPADTVREARFRLSAINAVLDEMLATTEPEWSRLLDDFAAGQTDLQPALAELSGPMKVFSDQITRLETVVADERALAKSWEARAMIAVRAGSDGRAREALERYAQHQARVSAFEDELAQSRAERDVYRKAIDTLSRRFGVVQPHSSLTNVRRV